MLLNRASSSASRLPSQLSSSLMFVRTKKTNKSSHFPKEPKLRSYAPFIPQIRSPHDIRAPHPTSSAHTSHPYEFQPYIPKTTSIPLENTELRLHHSPPASAPSYTTGAVPALLQWIGGESLTLTGEENAPKRISTGEKVRKPEGLVRSKDWSEERKEKIIALRAEGKSQAQICKALNIPSLQRKAIAFVAPQTKEGKEAQEAKAMKALLNMSYRGRVRKAINERRKEFW